MPEYNFFHVKLSNSKVIKLKSGVKTSTNSKSFIKYGLWF